jgi:hypothetical protein
VVEVKSHSPNRVGGSSRIPPSHHRAYSSYSTFPSEISLAARRCGARRALARSAPDGPEPLAYFAGSSCSRRNRLIANFVVGS